MDAKKTVLEKQTEYQLTSKQQVLHRILALVLLASCKILKVVRKKKIETFNS